jgi:hypothetical protein
LHRREQIGQASRVLRLAQFYTEAMRWLAFSFLLLLSLSVAAETVAGLKWTAPAGWTNQGSRPMRAATYVISAGNESGECAIYFFGQGSGGTVEANIERWKGQFTAPDGKPAAAVVKKQTVNGLPVTTIESQGNYTGMGGPMATARTEMKGFRLLGAIVEGPGGNIFLKFTGPDKLVATNRAKFTQLLDSIQKAQ